MTRGPRVLIAVLALVAATVVLQLDLRGLLPGQVRLEAPNTMLMSPPSSGQGAPGGVSAQRPAAAAAPNAARVQLRTSAAASAPDGYVLAASVATPDGRPAAGATVTFYEVVDLLGSREMLIDSATSDGRGNASVVYLPARAGSHEIVARSTGIAKAASGEARSTLEATVTAKAYAPETPSISAFYNAVPYGVGLVVLAVWLLIAFALLGTARGVVRGARREEEKGVIA
ncbi:MAG: hypothetical protein KGK34_03435 [Chloroflexota bacterium]|nr:hypothetical protein [Chloroflexota bacterium]